MVSVTEDDEGSSSEMPCPCPMLDSVVQTYLADDDLGADAPFGERALALSRGHRRDLTSIAGRCARPAGSSQDGATTSPRCGSSTAYLVGTSRRLIRDVKLDA